MSMPKNPQPKPYPMKSAYIPFRWHPLPAFALCVGVVAAYVNAGPIPYYKNDLEFETSLPSPHGAAFRVIHNLNAEYARYPLFSPDSSKVIISNYKIFDVKSGDEITRLSPDLNATRTNRSFSPDGDYFFFEGRNTLQVWHTKTGRLEAEHTINRLQRVAGPYAFSTSFPEQTVTVHNARTGARISVLQGSEGVSRIAISSDLSKLAMRGPGDLVRVWDVQTGAILHTFRVDSLYFPTHFYFSNNGDYLAISGMRRARSSSGIINTVWHLPSQRRLLDFQIPGYGFGTFYFSKDDRHLILSPGHSAEPLRETMIWRLDGSQAEEIHRVRSQAAIFTPNPRFALIFHQHPDNYLRRTNHDEPDYQEVFDLESREVVMLFMAEDPGLILGSDFSPNGRYAMSDGSGEILEMIFLGGRARIGDDVVDWDTAGDEPDEWPRIVPEIEILPTAPSWADGNVKLRLSVSNEGRGPAYGLAARVHTEPEALFGPQAYPVFLGNLPPGGAIERNILLPISEPMLEGPVRYRIEFIDVYRAAPRDIHFEHALFSEEPLPLQFNLSWQSDNGETNGPLSPGDVVDLQFQIHNLSQDSEADLEVAFSLPDDPDLGIVGENTFSLTTLPAGSSESLSLQLGIRPRFNSGQIELTAIVLDRSQNQQVRQRSLIPVALE